MTEATTETYAERIARADRTRTAELDRITSAVAAELGAGWTVEELDPENRGRSAYLAGPDGARVAVRWAKWDDLTRLEILGVYPHDADGLPYGVTHHVITASSGKSARALAGDITRRALPPYLEDLAKVTERRAERDTDAAELERRAARLVWAAPLKVSREHRNQHDQRTHTTESLRIYSPASSGPWGHVDVSGYSDRATLELHDLTEEQILGILAVIFPA